MKNKCKKFQYILLLDIAESKEGLKRRLKLNKNRLKVLMEATENIDMSIEAKAMAAGIYYIEIYKIKNKLKNKEYEEK